MESGRIQLQDLFRYDRVCGFTGCGALPGFAREWTQVDEAFDPAWFSSTEQAAPGTAVFAQGTA
jgi:pilus assembly protein CpaF